MVELLVCTILLSVVATVLVPGIHSVYKQRKSTQRELLTMFELNNLATQIHSGVGADHIELTTAYSSRYPAASFRIKELKTTKNGDAVLHVTISYPAGNAAVASEQSLTVWKAQSESSP